MKTTIVRLCSLYLFFCFLKINAQLFFLPPFSQSVASTWEFGVTLRSGGLTWCEINNTICFGFQTSVFCRVCPLKLLSIGDPSNNDDWSSQWKVALNSTAQFAVQSFVWSASAVSCVDDRHANATIVNVTLMCANQAGSDLTLSFSRQSNSTFFQTPQSKETRPFVANVLPGSTGLPRYQQGNPTDIGCQRTTDRDRDEQTNKQPALIIVSQRLGCSVIQTVTLFIRVLDATKAGWLFVSSGVDSKYTKQQQTMDVALVTPNEPVNTEEARTDLASFLVSGEKTRIFFFTVDALLQKNGSDCGVEMFDVVITEDERKKMCGERLADADYDSKNSGVLQGCWLPVITNYWSSTWSVDKYLVMLLHVCFNSYFVSKAMVQGRYKQSYTTMHVWNTGHTFFVLVLLIILSPPLFLAWNTIVAFAAFFIWIVSWGRNSSVDFGTFLWLFLRRYCFICLRLTTQDVHDISMGLAQQNSRLASFSKRLKPDIHNNYVVLCEIICIWILTLFFSFISYTRNL